jgi:pimeloyl-ACP methyl ester carboxylesterase
MLPLRHLFGQGRSELELTKIPRKQRQLDDAARAAAPGQFAALSDGMTHYEIAGPVGALWEDARRPVVFVHGFSVPSFVWEPAFHGLADVGFWVVRYDLLGRGYSDRPRARYDQELFDHQLRDLIEVLALDVPVDLIGLSMGGAIAAGFTDRHPASVRRLILIDPAGYSTRGPRGTWLLRVPLLGELLMATVGRRLLLSSLASDVKAESHGRMAEELSEMARRYVVQTQYKGFWRALLSTIRHGPIRNMAATYARVGRHERRVLVIWGREDRTVPFALSEQVRAAMPRAEFHAIEDAAHAPHLEQPELVNPLLIEFLRRK